MSVLQQKEQKQFLGEGILSKQRQIDNATVQKSNYLQWYNKQFKTSILDQATQNSDLEEYAKSLVEHNIVYSKNVISQKFRFSFMRSSPNLRYIDVIVRLSYFQIKLCIYNLTSQDRISFQQLNEIGWGSYGSVSQYLKSKMHPDQNFAIKKVNLQGDQVQGVKNIIKQCALIKLFSALRIGPAFKSLFSFDIILNQTEGYLSMQKGSSISNYLNSQQFLQQEVLQQKLNQVTESIKLMHSLNIVHMDIKIENLVYSDQFQKIVMIDFGLTQAKTIKQGLMQNQNFKGSFHYCSDDMKKLFFTQRQKLVDVFYNDYVCWRKTKQSIMLSFNLRNIEINPMQNNYRVIHQNFQIEDNLFLLRVLFQLKKGKFGNFNNWICQNQDCTRFFKLHFQNVLLMLDDQQQINLLFSFIKHLDLPIYCDLNQCREKHEDYNSLTKNIIKRRFNTQLSTGYIYDISLSSFFDNYSYEQLTPSQQFIISYHKYVKNKSFDNFQHKQRLHKLVSQLINSHIIQNITSLRNVIQIQNAQFAYILSNLKVQVFVKVLQTFQIRKIIKNLILTQIPDQKDFIKDLDKQIRQKQQFIYRKYEVNKFCYIVLLYSQTCNTQLINNQRIKPNIDFIKVLKSLFDQCLSLETQLNKKPKFPLSRISVKIIKQWLLVQYIKTLLSNFVQTQETQSTQLLNFYFLQLLQLYNNYKDVIFKQKPALNISIQYAVIKYEINFVPSFSIEEVNLISSLKQLLQKLYMQKVSISYIDFEFFVLKIFQSLVTLLMKYNYFKQAVYYIDTVFNKLNETNKKQAYQLKYILAKIMHNDRQIYLIQALIFGKQNKLQQKNCRQNHQQSNLKTDQCLSKNGQIFNFNKNIQDKINYVQRENMIKKQFRQGQKKKIRNCSLSRCHQLLTQQLQNEYLNFQNKESLLQEYKKYFQLQKEQIQRQSSLLQFRYKFQVNIIKIMKIFQIWSRYVLVLIQHQTDQQKVSMQRLAYKQFVEQHKLTKHVQFIEVEFNCNRKNKNIIKEKQLILQYFKESEVSFDNLNICFYVQLLNITFKQQSLIPEISQLDYYKKYLRIFQYILKAQKISIFFTKADLFLQFLKNLISVCFKNLHLNYMQNMDDTYNLTFINLIFEVFQRLGKLIFEYPCSNYSKYLLQVCSFSKICLRKQLKLYIFYLQNMNQSQSARSFKKVIQNQLFNKIINKKNISRHPQIIAFFYSMTKVVFQKEQINQITKKISLYIQKVSHLTREYILNSFYFKLYLLNKQDKNSNTRAQNKCKNYLLRHFRRVRTVKNIKQSKGKLKQQIQFNIFDFQKNIFQQ